MFEFLLVCLGSERACSWFTSRVANHKESSHPSGGGVPVEGVLLICLQCRLDT
jgi:hypothetical protein